MNSNEFNSNELSSNQLTTLEIVPNGLSSSEFSTNVNTLPSIIIDTSAITSPMNEFMVSEIPVSK